MGLDLEMDKFGAHVTTTAKGRSAAISPFVCIRATGTCERHFLKLWENPNGRHRSEIRLRIRCIHQL